MKARTRLRLWAALFAAALLAISTALSLAAAQAASNAHEYHVGAGAAHQFGTAGNLASQPEAASHCHTGFDCLVMVMLLPDRSKAPALALRPEWNLPPGALFSSLAMSPQPPPPRVGSV